MKLAGKISWFGGPDDEGVSPSEGLALYEPSQIDEHPELFLPYQPEGTTGLARRLNPDSFYIATRWDYDQYSKEELRDTLVLVYAQKTGEAFLCRPVDWGPHDSTDRIADLSPGLMEALGLETDDEVEIIYPIADIKRKPQVFAFAISSGHSTKCKGAVGLIDEVEEATRVVDEVARVMNKKRGVIAHTFHDTVSDDQSENLNRIVDWHNDQQRVLDVSIHFNANKNTEAPVGTECLYLTQESLARGIAQAVSASGKLIDRGPKYRSDLFFLNNTDEPAILIEVCFVDSVADVDAYMENFKAICESIANVLAQVEVIA